MNYKKITKALAQKLAKAALLTLMATSVCSASFAQAKTDDEPVYTTVEKLPRFPGDISGFIQYLKENLKYPEAAKKVKKEGRVNVTFIVEKDGSITDVHSVGRTEPLLVDEAVRVIKASPRWTAGSQDGKKVRVRYTVPVVFALKS
ncbi:energy transducer TonB [Mucilaginibacter aquatilis]|uniref:TonB family protein n=1 Tax=Mucilaginibacter aquatilis TaxID=1517760 RepID=A0A6I4IBL9_9SPHI|nr:energy transducer TonB [Mucilaginibacter aquatilis]MVN92650.1 TonB family protein [Mucilaginibacter aquatilis]